MTNYLLFVSGGEIFLVMMLALLFFGAEAIPGIAKTLGKAMHEFKKASNEIQREISEHTADIKKDVADVSATVNKETKDIEKGITDNFQD
jgi:sec-independent protein translocase protein TatA